MDKIEELLSRGVDRIYPSRVVLEKVLRSEKKLRLYQGFDPTGTQLHIGHMVGFKKLAQFQALGHHVIFVIGDGTGQAGDPSGKTTSRDKFLTQEELRKNAVDYVKQAGKIIRFDGENPVQILYNGDWLNKLTLVEILDIIGHFSLQQLLERDLFQERIKNKEDVNLREFFYPLLQAYDSVAMKVDMEIGGSDQTFNMLCGRKLSREMLGMEKYVLTTPLLEDSLGRKIGKTEGNVIALTDSPTDLYRKIMALGDEVVIKALEYLTNLPMEEISRIDEKIKNGANPIEFKKKLAFEVTKQLNNDAKAKEAQEGFGRIMQQGDISALERIPLTWTPTSGASISNVMANDLHIFESVSDAKRTILQGGTAVAGQIVTDPNTDFSGLFSGSTMEIVIGKKRAYTIKKNG